MRTAASLRETPPKMMRLDALASFVPAIEAGALAMRQKAEADYKAFRWTDYGLHIEAALDLENLAHRLDVRRVR